MRVIAGSAKGIPLQPVPGSRTRPISDRVKESVFNILADWIAGARVLDLFAGTGSVGIEALSRGATEVTFVERYPKAASVIRDNLRRTRLQAGSRVVQEDVFRYLEGEPDPYDLVYVAPPQYEGLWKATLLALETHPGWLKPDGMAIVQIFPKEYEPIPLTRLEMTDQRRYGSTLLCFYEPSPPEGEPG